MSQTKTEILHLTPHLGGGVGKALSSLYVQSARTESSVRHSFVCLEAPEKSVFLQRILDAGGKVYITPDDNMLSQLIDAADVVHLDWWNHPAIFESLCKSRLPPMRLVVWSHVSGLHVPFIPVGLLKIARGVVFTSPCTLEAEYVQRFASEGGEKLYVVSSGCGLEDFPVREPKAGPSVRAGYVGSLNFTKLHPQYIDYLAAVSYPGFQVDVFGDTLNQEELENRCDKLGKPNLLRFNGFTSDIVAALKQLDILIYLLHPEHYGTAENALIEAMGMGVIPIVLDNPAERCIVDDGVTGFVIQSPSELSMVVSNLAADQERRIAISQTAERAARKLYTSDRMESGLANVYEKVCQFTKERIDFVELFGGQPADWFLVCQGEESPFNGDGTVSLDERMSIDFLMERSKGSIFHFSNFFPSDSKLKAWANELMLAR